MMFILFFSLGILSGDYAGMYYGADHPMKPPRIAMAHSLIVGYGLQKKMDVYVRFIVYIFVFRT